MKKISILRVTALMALGCAFGLTSSAHADTLFASNPSSPGYDDSDYVNVGDDFTVGSSNLFVTDLGAYVPTSDTAAGVTTSAFTATLYSENTSPSANTGSGAGTEIGSVTIPIGTVVTDGFAFASFSYELGAGNTYGVTDFIVTPTAVADVSGYEKTPFTIDFYSGTAQILTTGAGTSFYSGTANDIYTVYSSSLAPDPSVTPGVNSGNSGYYAFGGGNLEYSFTAPSVPEPSTYALLLGGFVLFAGYLRRRSA